jgi:hypothetical protein
MQSIPKKTMKTTLRQFSLLAISLACLAHEAKGASPAVNTFRLQSRSAMNGTGTATGPRGWASSLYGQRGTNANQDLQISCRSLTAGEVYHLMASTGTNGELVHLSDFMPNRSGAILMHYSAGTPHHFVGTNNPGAAWWLTGGWTNHMSWVIYPGNGTNWCSPEHAQGITGQYGTYGGMGGYGGGMGGYGGGMGGYGGGMGGYGGGMGWGGDWGWGSGWPAMTNWWSGMSGWWPMMANWCWNYTNMWNMGAQYGGFSTNWWGSLARGGNHMMPWPYSLSAAPAINGLVVTDANLQPVLSVDLANPDSFGYRVRCDFDNQGIIAGAAATLQANATQRSTHFALSATGLAPSTTYFMAINDANLTTVATDAHGRLRMNHLPSGVASMRGIGRISLLDRNHNAVLSADLPPG